MGEEKNVEYVIKPICNSEQKRHRLLLCSYMMMLNRDYDNIKSHKIKANAKVRRRTLNKAYDMLKRSDMRKAASKNK